MEDDSSNDKRSRPYSGAEERKQPLLQRRGDRSNAPFLERPLSSLVPSFMKKGKREDVTVSPEVTSEEVTQESSASGSHPHSVPDDGRPQEGRPTVQVGSELSRPEEEDGSIETQTSILEGKALEVDVDIDISPDKDVDEDITVTVAEATLGE